MSDGGSAIDLAIAAVADGTPIDWHTLERDVPADERTRLQCARIISDIAGYYQSSDPILPRQSHVNLDVHADPPASGGTRTWGKYRLLEQVGEGSFGSVYRAWDPDLEREVAIKILHKRIPDEEAQHRLLDEGRALAKIRHPHVVGVLGIESHDEQAALCMEFVHGETLESTLQRQGPLGAREAALAGTDICRALAAVHVAGFAHCDVKARNVMREAGGRIVLMDFGSTAAFLKGDGAAHPGGTPLYLAPELLAGAHPTPASDVYSLGVLLYHLASGQFPVVGSSLDELRHAHTQGKRQSLRDIRSDLPIRFVQAVDEATAAQPDRRPASVGAMERLLSEVVGVASTTSAASRDSRASIAVLPFSDTSPDGALEFFCDGVAEELTNALASVDGLHVVSRSSSFRFKGATEDIRRVAEALGVGTVLEGSVRAVGNRLRVVARLIDAREGFQLWSERFDRRLDDVFTVQDGIVRAVVNALRKHAELSGSATPVHASAAPAALVPATTGTRDFEAYTFYLKGRHLWNKRTETSLARSVGYFRSAIDRDATYADAYAGLAEAEATLGLYGAVAPKQAMPDAQTAARQALELHPSLAGALATWGCVTGIYEWSWARAEHYYRRAIELNPGDAGAHHWYAINHLVPLQRFEEAAAELRYAQEADPLSMPIAVSGGLLAYFSRRYQEAHDRLKESFELDPHLAMARLFLGLTLVEMGRFGEAIDELTIAMQLTNSPESSAALAYACARAGHRDRANASLLELADRSSERYVSPSLLAQIHAGLGNTDQALGLLERAFEHRAADLAWLGVRPVFDDLRSDARFAALLQRLGQPSIN